MCGFRLGKIEKSKKITLLKDIQGRADLENKLVQNKIIILPLNDFPNDLPVVEHDSFSSRALISNPIESSNHIHQENNYSDHLEPVPIKFPVKFR